MSDMMVKIDVRQLVAQLSWEEKTQLFHYLETELAMKEDDRAMAYLERMGLIQPLPKVESEPPISEAEARALADRAGASGSISALIIEERQSATDSTKHIIGIIELNREEDNMADLMITREIENVLELVSQLSPEDKQTLLRHLLQEQGLGLHPQMNIKPPMTREEARKLADEVGKAGPPLSRYIIEEREEGY